MRKYKKCESVFFIHYSSRQEGEDDFCELVHHGDQRPPVAESMLSLLVIIGTEEGGIDDSSLSHYVRIFSEAPVAVFGYVPFAIAFSGLIDGRIGAHVCDEILVGGESGDVLDLGHEMGCRNLPDSRDGLEDFHLLLMLYKSLCEGFVPLLKEEDLLCPVLHEFGVPRYSYASDGIVLDVLHGDGEIVALPLREGTCKLSVVSGEDLIWRGEGGEEGEHGGCKHIDSKDFRPGQSEVALELGLNSCYILNDFLPSSCGVPLLIIHSVLLHTEYIVIGKPYLAILRASALSVLVLRSVVDFTQFLIIIGFSTQTWKSLPMRKWQRFLW